MFYFILDEALSKLTKQIKLLEDEKETVISNNKRLIQLIVI